MNSGSEVPGGPYGPPHTEIIDASHDTVRRRPRLAGLLAVAVVALAAGGGIAYLATNSGNDVSTVASRGAAQTPAPSPSASPPSFRHRGPGFGPLGGLGGLGGLGAGGLGGAIHGQVTVPKSGGGYQTVDVQRGMVTDVSQSSITVKSADGYSATYVVSSSTEVNAQAAGIGTVHDGDTVALAATVSGSIRTADSIIDLTSIRSSRGSFGFPPGPPGGAQN